MTTAMTTAMTTDMLSDVTIDMSSPDDDPQHMTGRFSDAVILTPPLQPAQDQPSMPKTVPPVVEIVTSDEWQAQIGADTMDAETIVERAIIAAAALVPDDIGATEVAVLLTDDATVKTLNRDFRHIDKPTNVLSFPSPDLPQAAGEPHMLGDIAIACGTTRREAQEEEKPFADHLSHLAIHGFLHLLGYDHLNDEDAETMEGLERVILAHLGIMDPYMNSCATRDGEH